MKRAIRHMRYAKMSKCLNQWCATVDAAIHRRVIVARAAARFRQRLVSKAFSSMEDYASTRIHQRNLVLRVLHKVDNFALHKSFSKMLSVIADAKSVQLQKEQLLLEMSNGMANAKDLEQLILLTMHQAKELVDADRATLFLIDTKTGHYYTHLAENTAPINCEKGKGLVGVCIENGEVLNINDARNDRRFNDAVDRRTGYETKEVLCVPLKDSSNSIMGAIQVINRRTSRKQTEKTDVENEGSDAVWVDTNDTNATSNAVCPFTLHEVGCLERMASQVQIGVQAILQARREGKWKMARFLTRWSNTKLTKTWNNWSVYVQNEQRLRNMTKRCVLLWQRKCVRRALNSWIDYWETRTYKRTLLARVLSRMTKQRMHIGFQSW